MPGLERKLNTMLARLRVIEEAVYGGHDWSFRLNGANVTWELPAQVQRFADGVRFVTTIPAEIAFGMAELRMDGETVQIMERGMVCDHAYVYVWEITVGDPLSVG